MIYLTHWLNLQKNQNLQRFTSSYLTTFRMSSDNLLSTDMFRGPPSGPCIDRSSDVVWWWPLGPSDSYPELSYLWMYPVPKRMNTICVYEFCCIYLILSCMIRSSMVVRCKEVCLLVSNIGYRSPVKLLIRILYCYRRCRRKSHKS